jgi:hypothetical protein
MYRVKLSEQEITFLVEIDASIAGRQLINQDETAKERALRVSLVEKGLVMTTHDSDEYIELTFVGEQALSKNE